MTQATTTQRTTHGPGRRRTTAQLRALVAEANKTLGADPSAAEVVAWASETFGDALAVACSMAADTVVPHLVAQTHPGVDVLFLDTGYHFTETIGTRDALAADLDVNFIDVRPVQSVEEQDAAHGERLYERDPGLCCQLRKVDPINDELLGYEAWVTGVRRADNALRASAQPVEWDETHQMIKVNPLVAWEFDELIEYAGANQVPINLLLTEGYPSIGCAPCTRPVADGEDPRSGRWAGLAKTECGLHL